MFRSSASLRLFSRAARVTQREVRRTVHQASGPVATGARVNAAGLIVGVGTATGALLLSQSVAECAWYDSFVPGGKKEAQPTLDPVWDDVRKAISAIIEDDNNYGPLFVRLAWHASGTYCAKDNSGGSNGATMRFEPESGHGANKGLHLAREALAPIQAKHPNITFADLWTFAGCVAIENMGGPKIPWAPGRSDHKDGSSCPVDGRLPDASKDAVHIREIFYRMGFNDQEIVALIGAHTLGFCHADRSGYDGPWTRDPYKLDNSFYTLLLKEPWRVKVGSDPVQFTDSTGELMMLPADLALIIDPNFRTWVKKYAADEKLFHKDFAAAFGRLLSLGVPPPKPAAAH